MNRKIDQINQENRQKAIDDYYNNPNICLNCQEIIKIIGKQKISQVKIKKYCNKYCSVTHHNKISPKRKRIQRKERKLRKNSFSITSKKELYERTKNWQSANSSIRKTARKIYSKSGLKKECFVCGYNKHIEICHIKNVSEFNDEATINEINDITNLVALCPNHHWEFDNHLISIDEIKKVA